MRLLSFDYRPQLADLPEPSCGGFNPIADYGRLASAVHGKIDLGQVRAHWPPVSLEVVVAAVRAAIGSDVPLLYRVSVEEASRPGAQPPGLDLADGLAFCDLLARFVDHICSTPSRSGRTSMTTSMSCAGPPPRERC